MAAQLRRGIEVCHARARPHVHHLACVRRTAPSLRRSLVIGSAAAAEEEPAAAGVPAYSTVMLAAACSDLVYTNRDKLEEKDFKKDPVVALEKKLNDTFSKPKGALDVAAADVIANEKTKGFTLEKFIATEDYKKDERFRDTECAVFVAPRYKRIVVAFRGTEFNWRDWRTNFTIGYTSIGDATDNVDSKVHEGFKSAYFNGLVLERVETLVKELYVKHSKSAPGEWGVLLTGHSQGGAIATICAFRFATRAAAKLKGLKPPAAIEAVTFASPRVGDAVFKDEIEAALGLSLLRIVNNADIVPRLPPSFLGYRHSGPFVKLGPAPGGQATYYRADEESKLGWGLNPWDHTLTKGERGSVIKLNRLGEDGWNAAVAAGTAEA